MDDGFMPEELPPLVDTVFKAVVINDAGPHRIQYIKLLRQVAEVDLKTAKELAERPTPYVLAACDEVTAAGFQSLAAAAGVACELKDYDETMEPAIADDQPFNLLGTGRGGCATTMLLLATTAAGVIYGLVVFLRHLSDA